ncbi:MAG: mechanosensitive ion channel family protein [Planctomycetota bacterium]
MNGIWMMLQEQQMSSDAGVDQDPATNAWQEFVQSDAAGLVLNWALVLFAAWLANLITKRVILKAVRMFVGKTKAQWDDKLVERKIFHKLSHLAPALVFYYAAPHLAEGSPLLGTAIVRLATVWMILAGTRAAAAFLDVMVDVARTQKSTRDKPMGSYAQVVKLLMWLAVIIVVLGILMDRSPWGLLTGLGAMTAIILLVFKDSILGFVASIQIASYDMVRVGDWVEMPKFGADGDVIEISLNTVKIQNWDKTISTVPTYAFMSDSFKNWRGMSESGGRRIKRSVSLDMGSVRFLGQEEIEQLRSIQYIEEYLAKKSEEVSAWNQEHGVDLQSPVNGRRLTNLGTFRAYVESYLHNHPQIHKEMTFLVRQLAPSTEGVPIEIYVFSSEQRWAYYEAIIGDIFDHLLAVIPEFGLRVYQRPSGSDFEAAFRGRD